MDKRICKWCGKSKSVPDFSMRQKSVCKSCMTANSRIYRRLQREKRQTGFVYALVDSRNLDIFYIGCAADPKTRYSEHLRDARLQTVNFDRCRRISKILCAGGELIMMILEEIPLGDMLKCEAHWIIELANEGFELLNRKVLHQQSKYL